MLEKPRQFVTYITFAAALLFAAAYTAYVVDSVSGVPLDAAALAVLVAKTGVELVASTYGIAFLISAFAFLFVRENTFVGEAPSDASPPVGILYLCCDDADWSAFESLTRLTYEGPIFVVIHDDSRTARARAAVDRMASTLAAERDWDVRVLRRPDKAGGKPAAVNYALDQTWHLYDYFLLCDNDSTVLDPETIQKGLARMRAPNAGIVQFRSVPVDDPGYCGVNRRLAESIGAFHAFLSPAARHGWMPFIGHNALLRTSAVKAVGGMTPDFFSDDLDLTVRLNLSGFRVAYAAEIAMGEKHPPSYTAFRKRSYKWAYGCVQTLRAHSWSVLTARQFTFAEKVSFFQFAGFYCLQAMLLVYMCFVLLAVPFGALGTFAPDLTASLIVGTVLVGLVYAPLLSFYVKAARNRHPGWIATLALCGLVYGGTDFSVVRGVVDAFRRQRRAWVPTNGVSATAVDLSLFAEAVFGVLLLAVPIAYLPELLYLPCWFLFAGKFLFGPALSLFYRDEAHDTLAPFVDPRAYDHRALVVDARSSPAFD